jgi:hypothetical protein
MDSPSSPRFLEITVETRQDLDTTLNAAVVQLLPAAMAEVAGIQVARSGVGTYTASVRHDISFGTTIESWELPKAAAGIGPEASEFSPSRP